MIGSGMQSLTGFVSTQNVYLSHLQSYNAHEAFIAMILVTYVDELLSQNGTMQLELKTMCFQMHTVVYLWRESWVLGTNKWFSSWALSSSLL